MFGLLSGFETAYIVDIVVVFMVLYSAYSNGKKGFIRCVFGLITTVVALAVAFFCSETILAQTNGLFGLQPILTEKITEMFTGIEILNMPVESGDIAAMLSQVPLPEFLLTMVVDAVALDGVAPGTTLAVHIGGIVGDFSALILTGIVLFIICKLVLSMVEKLFSKIVRSVKLFGFIDSVLGSVVGVLKTAIFVLLILLVISVIPNPEIVEFLDNTFFVGELYHNNPINLIFAMVFGS